MNNKYPAFILGFTVVGVLSVMLGVVFFRKSDQPVNTNTQTKKIQVIASFYPLYFFASQIGGDKAQVQNLTPAGAEPHDYEPTPQDIAKIQNSDLLILNGNVEAWGNNIKDNLQGTKTKIVVAGQDLFTQQITDEEGKTGIDPHVWLSFVLAKKESEKIARVLAELDPANTKYYQDNKSKLDSRLNQIGQSYKQGLSGCKQKDIITSHAAFGYLAKAYGFTQVPIAGLSPDEEPSSQQLAQVADFARKHNVKYIFFEKLVSPKLSDTLAGEIGAKTLILDPLEGLSSDDIKNGKDYFTVMQNNLANLRIALQCNQ